MNSQDDDGASHDGDGASRVTDQLLGVWRPVPPSNAVSSPTNFPAPMSLSSLDDGASHDGNGASHEGDGASRVTDQLVWRPVPPSNAVSSPTNFPAPMSLSSLDDGASHDGNGASRVTDQLVWRPVPPSNAVSSPTNFPAPTSLSSLDDGASRVTDQLIGVWRPVPPSNAVSSPTNFPAPTSLSSFDDGASHDGDGASSVTNQRIGVWRPVPPSNAVSSPTNFPAPTSLSPRLDQRPEQNVRQHQYQFRSGNQQDANQQFQIRHPFHNQPPGPFTVRSLASYNFRNVIGLQNRSVLPNNLSGDPNRSYTPSTFRRINSSGMPFGNTNAPPSIPNQISPATGIYGTHNIPNQNTGNFEPVYSCPKCGYVLKGLVTEAPSNQNEKMIREQSAALAEGQASASSREAAILSSLERLAGKKIQVTGNGTELQISGSCNRSSSRLTLRRINSNLMPEQRFKKLPRIETDPEHPVPNYQSPEAAESGTERNSRNLEMQSEQLKFIAEFFDNQILAHFQQFMEKFETLETEKIKRENMWRVAGNSGASSSGSGNWLPEEEETLVKLRTQLEDKSRELGKKAPTWGEVSGRMEILGYKKDARRCTKKWQNITDKYFRDKKKYDEMKGVKKTYSYFKLLREYYSAREKDPERLLAPEMDNNEDPSTSSAHQNNVEGEDEEEEED